MTIPLYTCLPFIISLILIAVMPLACPKFWECNKNKAVILALVSLPVLLYLFFSFPSQLLITAEEYAAFIVLLAALYIISGGILITGDIAATPRVNTLFLLAGSILANFLGTTGASMILIRPLLSTNSERKRTKHIPLFFIFLVSNIGGLLTPLADPPLYMGYLKGVPFTWTLSLFPVWLVSVAVLLAVFYAVDSRQVRKERPEDCARDRATIIPFAVHGKINIIFLLGVVAAVFFQVHAPYREGIMLLMVVFSLIATKKEMHVLNKFTYKPIMEVAIIFAGIFATMVPLLLLLQEKGASLGVTRPWQFFWITGGLSSFLDNTPTYVTFFSLAESVTRVLPDAVSVAGVEEGILRALSCGAVLMGANTYIGNGPNFMVKAIADEQKFPIPHFFAYMGYAAAVLLPVFLLITFLFFW